MGKNEPIKMSKLNQSTLGASNTMHISASKSRVIFVIEYQTQGSPPHTISNTMCIYNNTKNLCTRTHLGIRSKMRWSYTYT